MGIGIGLGAFMEGLTKGMGTAVTVRDFMDKSAQREAYQTASTDARAARENDIGGALSQGVIPPAAEGQAPSWRIGDQTYGNEAEARTAAERQVGSFTDYYMRVGAPRVMEQYLQNGEPDKARAFGQWINQEGTQRGMRSWAGAIRAAQSGDAEGFRRNITDAYNNPQYSMDGRTVTGSRLLTDDQGNHTGMELTVKGRDGKETTQTFNGMADIYRQAASFMAPEKVVEHGMNQLTAADKARAEAARDGRRFTQAVSLSQLGFNQNVAMEGVREQYRVGGETRAEGRQIDQEDRGQRRSDANAARDSTNRQREAVNASDLRMMEDAARRAAGSDDPLKVGQVRTAMETMRNNLAQSDLNFSKKPFAEQMRIVEDQFRGQLSQARGVVRPAAPPSAQGSPGGVTVYSPPSGGQGVVPPR